MFSPVYLVGMEMKKTLSRKADFHVVYPSECISPICFAIFSQYFPAFNSVPFIRVPFSFMEGSLVNKGGRKAIKMDSALISKKLPRDTRGRS